MLTKFGLSVALLLALAIPATGFDADRLVVQVGYPPGASHDVVARSVANHVGRYLPGNPGVVVENVEGAGGLRLYNLYMAAGPRNGSTIITLAPTFSIDPLLNPGNTTVLHDPRDVTYLVSFSNTSTYCVATVASGIDSFDALVTMDDVVVASVGRSTSYYPAAAIQRIFGADFNIVTGFQGVGEVNLAMARGEADVFCGISASDFTTMRGIYDFNVVVELSPERNGAIEGVEFLLDRIEDPATREAMALVLSTNRIRFPLMTHPDTPAETVAILRDALQAVSADPAFVRELTATGFELSVTGGAEVQAIVEGFYVTDPAVQEVARALIQ